MMQHGMDLDFTATRRTILKSLVFGGAACMLGDLPASASRAAKLPRANPESLGISPDGIVAFIDAVEAKVGGLHSFMLLRHGKVAAEGWWAPYAAQHPHMLYSLSKSFTSTAVGFAVTEGLLTVEAPVTSFFPDSLPPTVGENLAAMRVKHLLSMGTGHDKDATGPTTAAADKNWVRAFLALPVEHAPGSKFVYNSAATYMLSAIVQKVTGKTVLEYLTPRLFQLIGIDGPTWETCPRGINTGGWGLSVKTEDIARFGQTYLQKGTWAGKQVIPEAWVTDATTKKISNGTDPNSDWAQGYCYQIWRCRHNAFRGDGAFGQYCVVMPDQDAVLAITSGIGDMQAVLTAVWDHLLPNMLAAVKASEMPTTLKQRIAALAIQPPAGKPVSPTAKRVSGKIYRFDANPQNIQSVSVDFEGKRATVALFDIRGGRKFECGNDAWVRGEAALPNGSPGKVAVRSAWADDDTFTTKLCFYETPYIQTTTLKFSGETVAMKSKWNVGFGPTEQPEIVGKAL